MNHLHYRFHCKKCRRPILLPVETFGQPFQGQEEIPTDAPLVAFADYRCKHVDTYALKDIGPLPSGAEGTAILAPRDEDQGIADMLKCVDADCEVRLPLVSHRNAASIPLAQWHFADMFCAKGHPIPVPVLRLVLEK